MATVNATGGKKRGVKPFPKREIAPGARIWLTGEGNFFCPGTARLLSLIEKRGSIMSACEEMGLSYFKAHKMVKKIERELGRKIVFVERISGLRCNGAVLTDVGKELVRRYGKMEKECAALVKKAYDKNFSGFFESL